MIQKLFQLFRSTNWSHAIVTKSKCKYFIHDNYICLYLLRSRKKITGTYQHEWNRIPCIQRPTAHRVTQNEAMWGWENVSRVLYDNETPEAITSTCLMAGEDCCERHGKHMAGCVMNCVYHMTPCSPALVTKVEQTLSAGKEVHFWLIFLQKKRKEIYDAPNGILLPTSLAINIVEHVSHVTDINSTRTAGEAR